MSNRPRHYKKQPPAADGKLYKLSDLITIREAAALWLRHPTTIMYHIERGNLAARQSGTIWLISKQSLIDYYGHSPLIRKRKNPLIS